MQELGFIVFGVIFSVVFAAGAIGGQLFGYDVEVKK
jgi:hypothetical protein